MAGWNCETGVAMMRMRLIPIRLRVAWRIPRTEQRVHLRGNIKAAELKADYQGGKDSNRAYALRVS